MMQRLGVRQPIMLIGGLAVTLSMDAPLTCIMLALLPVMAFLVYLFSSKGVPMYTKVQEAVDRFVRLVRGYCRYSCHQGTVKDRHRKK